eukprot:g5834.t1
MVYYCGRWCQSQDWKTHKIFCKYTQSADVKPTWKAVIENEALAPGRGYGGHASTIAGMRADLAYETLLTATSLWIMLLDYYATTGAKREIRMLHWSNSNVAREKSGKSDANPGTFFTDDEWLVIQNLADEVGERQRQVKDTETSALEEEDEHQGVDGGEAGVVRLVQGEDELLKGGHETVGLGGGNRAENKRNAAPSLAPRLEGKRNRNGVPVTWDGAAIAATNIVSQPRNRERTRPSNFRSGAFLVTIPVPYREATASGRFNESRFADIDKHLKLGAIVERHVSEKPPGEPLVPTSPARDGDFQCR